MNKRALISVSDKTGIVQLAKEFEKLNIEIISTGGTLKTLADNGVKAISISDITGFPECLDGRVKTLHPNVHAGLLAMRGNKEHMKQIEDLNIKPIDFVIVNLYPFKATVEKNAEFSEAVENIDIGGPTMLRSAAKNYQDVVTAVDPADYEIILKELKESGNVSVETKKYLMYKVFAHTAYYDSLISNYLAEKLSVKFPDKITFAYDKLQDMRYGENPQQLAAFYKEPFNKKGSLCGAVQLHGKELSYNNINDANGALDLLREFSGIAAVAVKHANPCGAASADTVYEAYMKAYEADKVSIFGGILAINGTVDVKTAEEINKIFIEIVIAKDYEDKALEVLKSKKNIRILKLSDINSPLNLNSYDMKKVYGGLLVQELDCKLYEQSEIKVVTKKAPTGVELRDLFFAWKVVKHTKSNAIVIAKNNATTGVGTGQTNRIWACKQAIEHAEGNAKGSVLASDAYFPFPDCVEECAKAGITAIIQPGGSVNDKLSIEACDKHGIAMLFCGMRHFKH